LSAILLDGLAVSKVVREGLKVRVDQLRAAGVQPRLDVIVASQDPSSMAYVRMKRRWAEQIGITGEAFSMDDSTTQEQLIARVVVLNHDPHVHGVLIQHPLPRHLDEAEALQVLNAAKDVDGLTPASMGLLLSDMPGFRPATPLGIMTLLRHYGITVEGKRAVVIGRSIILGKPTALLLMQQNATVTIAHSKTVDLPSLCREADILVAAVGRPEFVRGDWIKPGAIVIDAGYNKVPGRDKDVGDVHFGEAAEVASYLTPVPGGVGPMTVASLLANVVDAAERTVADLGTPDR